MAISTMRPAHNAKVLLSARRSPLSGHSFAVIVQSSHVPHPATSRRQAWLECCLFIQAWFPPSKNACPWSGSRSPDQGPIVWHSHHSGRARRPLFGTAAPSRGQPAAAAAGQLSDEQFCSDLRSLVCYALTNGSGVCVHCACGAIDNRSRGNGCAPFLPPLTIAPGSHGPQWQHSLKA